MVSASPAPPGRFHGLCLYLFRDIKISLPIPLCFEALAGVLAPGLEFSEIAFLLAYEDQGSFFRAFQKWENQTPSEWREA